VKSRPDIHDYAELARSPFLIPIRGRKRVKPSRGVDAKAPLASMPRLVALHVYLGTKLTC
jgi:hypothetical protein